MTTCQKGVHRHFADGERLLLAHQADVVFAEDHRAARLAAQGRQIADGCVEPARGELIDDFVHLHLAYIEAEGERILKND